MIYLLSYCRGCSGKIELNLDLWKVVSLDVGGRCKSRLTRIHDSQTGWFLPTFDIYLVLFQIRLRFILNSYLALLFNYYTVRWDLDGKGMKKLWYSDQGSGGEWFLLSTWLTHWPRVGKEGSEKWRRKRKRKKEELQRVQRDFGSFSGSVWEERAESEKETEKRRVLVRGKWKGELGKKRIRDHLLWVNETPVAPLQCFSAQQQEASFLRTGKLENTNQEKQISSWWRSGSIIQAGCWKAQVSWFSVQFHNFTAVTKMIGSYHVWPQGNTLCMIISIIDTMDIEV